MCALCKQSSLVELAQVGAPTRCDGWFAIEPIKQRLNRQSGIEQRVAQVSQIGKDLLIASLGEGGAVLLPPRLCNGRAKWRQ